MEKFIAQKREYCSRCSEEIPKGEFGWVDEFNNDDVLCEACFDIEIDEDQEYERIRDLKEIK